MSRRRIERRARALRRRRRKTLLWGVAAAVAVVVLIVLATQLPRNPGASSPVATRGEARRISPVEAKALLDSGSAVLYDTRSDEAYEAKHAVGAVSYPEGEREARFGTLPNDRDLIFY